MNLTPVIIVAVALILASAWATQTVNTPANAGKEHSKMSNTKVIMLIEAKIQPERRAEIIAAAQHYVPQVRAEPGVEAFYLSTREDAPNTLVFYEVYKSQAAQDSHLQQDFVKQFLATLKSAQTTDRVRTRLVEVNGQAEAQAN